MLKPLLIATLVTSVCLKVWAMTATSETKDVAAQPKLLTFLAAEDFTAREISYGWATVSGEAGLCRVLLGSIDAGGWRRDVVFSTAPPGSEVVFFFQGQAYPDQPKWRTWAARRIYELRQPYNKDLKADEVIAATIGKDCSIDKKLWAKMLVQI